MQDGVKVLLGIATAILLFVFFINWLLGASARLGRRIREKNEAAALQRVAPIIAQANKEYGTNFSTDQNKNIDSFIFFDPENKKIYLNNVQGLNGVKDYSFFRSWRYRTNNPGHYIEIYTKDAGVPLVTIQIPGENETKVTFARISALMQA